VILAALCLSPGCDQNARKPSTAQPLVPTVGYAAPEIDGVDLDGVDFKLSDYKGKVVMLDFWATWCPPCMKFLPHGKELVEKYKDRPFVALGVNTDKDVSLPKNCKDLAMRCWADGFGGGGPICTRWGIKAFPTVYVIDGDGIIRFAPDRVNVAKLDETIERLVRKAEGKS
jgi:thiol-disulfide isomerase/thioredoxin